MNLEGIDDDDVVISGIGFKLPEVDNLSELAAKLFNGDNFITENKTKFRGNISFFFILV